jgi:hypothetical protein
MFGGGLSATRTSYREFIRTTVAEPLISFNQDVDLGSGDLIGNARHPEKRTRIVFMLDFIPTNRRTWQIRLADLSSNIAISDSGVGLLAAQISDLENRCRAMRSRINHTLPERTPARGAQPV